MFGMKPRHKDPQSYAMLDDELVEFAFEHDAEICSLYEQMMSKVDEAGAYTKTGIKHRMESNFLEDDAMPWLQTLDETTKLVRDDIRVYGSMLVDGIHTASVVRSSVVQGCEDVFILLKALEDTPSFSAGDDVYENLEEVFVRAEHLLKSKFEEIEGVALINEKLTNDLYYRGSSRVEDGIVELIIKRQEELEIIYKKAGEHYDQLNRIYSLADGEWDIGKGIARLPRDILREDCERIMNTALSHPQNYLQPGETIGNAIQRVVSEIVEKIVEEKMFQLNSVFMLLEDMASSLNSLRYEKHAIVAWVKDPDNLEHVEA